MTRRLRNDCDGSVAQSGIVETPAVVADVLPTPPDGERSASFRQRPVTVGAICLLVVVGCSQSNDQQFETRVQLVRDGKTNVIDIREKPISGDMALEKLSRTVGLRKLNLDNSPVTDSGLRSLGSMPDLRELSLTRTLITDDAISIIVKQFPGVDNLRLDETAITDKQLAVLGELTSLRQLSLYRTRITDAGCADLAKISSLKKLSLDQTRVTNVGLKAFQESPSLESLSLWKTVVTDEGAEEFLKAKPDVKLNR